MGSPHHKIHQRGTRDAEGVEGVCLIYDSAIGGCKFIEQTSAGTMIWGGIDRPRKVCEKTIRCTKMRSVTWNIDLSY